ncbi:hypothetical protein BC937DRAFT_91076 [Endogone sp. FLAS-F59071]|nr:hypothetical protein BC937DRAFT_91076 [Endogone sp. FLAS-F59071]|eukprot:RUS16560.1 hypothetical protein BC937DRAFT_91076 [Endogone sp. FLAS-F59071]
MGLSFEIKILQPGGQGGFQRGFFGLTETTVSGWVRIRVKNGKRSVRGKLVVIKFVGYEYTDFVLIDPIGRYDIGCGSTRLFHKEERTIWAPKDATDLDAIESFTELDLPFSFTVPPDVRHSSFKGPKGGVQYDLAVLIQHNVKTLFGSKDKVERKVIQVPLACYLPLVLSPAYRSPLIFFCTTNSSEAGQHGFAYDITFPAKAYGPGDVVQAHIRLQRVQGYKSTPKSLFLGIKRHDVCTDAGNARNYYKEFIARREVGGLRWQTDEIDPVGHLDLVTSLDVPLSRTANSDSNLKYISIKYELKMKIEVDGAPNVELEAPVTIVGVGVTECKRAINILRARPDVVLPGAVEPIAEVLNAREGSDANDWDEFPPEYDDGVDP